MSATDGVGSPIRIRKGSMDGDPGIFWAWPIDGYFDLHHSPEGIDPDGSDVIGECYFTMAEVRQEVREILALERLRF